MVDLSYAQKPSYEKHRLRPIVIKETKAIYGISLAEEKIERFIGCYFTTRIEGTSIILESGTAPQKK